MPTVSTFFGIAIRIYFDDHGPAHFHAYYQNDTASVAIETLEVLSGQLPRRALALVLEWAVAHRLELRENWNLAAEHEHLKPIAPLT